MIIPQQSLLDTGLDIRSGVLEHARPSLTKQNLLQLLLVHLLQSLKLDLVLQFALLARPMLLPQRRVQGVTLFLLPKQLLDLQRRQYHEIADTWGVKFLIIHAHFFLG